MCACARFFFTLSLGDGALGIYRRGNNGLERRDSIGGKKRVGASDREHLTALVGKLQRGVPERILKIRRAIRNKNRQALEMELLKLSAALPPLGGQALQTLLPPNSEASDQEWEQAKEGLAVLEQALDQLREGLEKLL